MESEKPLRLNDRQCRIFMRDMHEFGYKDVTFDEIRKMADDYADGKEASKTDVVEMMLRRQLAEIEEEFARRAGER